MLWKSKRLYAAYDAITAQTQTSAPPLIGAQDNNLWRDEGLPDDIIVPSGESLEDKDPHSAGFGESKLTCVCFAGLYVCACG